MSGTYRPGRRVPIASYEEAAVVDRAEVIGARSEVLPRAGARYVAVAGRQERDPDALTVGRAAWIRTAPHQTRLHRAPGSS